MSACTVAAALLFAQGAAGRTHTAMLAKGNFVLGVPVVKGTNTLRWYLQIGPARWPGPDIVYSA